MREMRDNPNTTTALQLSTDGSIYHTSPSGCTHMITSHVKQSACLMVR